MTRLELVDTLEERVGWKQPTATSFVVDATNLTSEGGRFFQDQHDFVKISTIKELMEKPNGTDSEVNAYLTELRKRVVLLVVDEAFSGYNINNLVIADCLELLDAAISKRMAMKLGEILMASVRSNRVERISKEAMKYFFFDLNGDVNYPNKISISEGYSKELSYLKDMFNTENTLDVVTLGNNRNDYTEDYLRFE